MCSLTVSAWTEPQLSSSLYPFLWGYATVYKALHIHNCLSGQWEAWFLLKAQILENKLTQRLSKGFDTDCMFILSICSHICVYICCNLVYSFQMKAPKTDSLCPVQDCRQENVSESRNSWINQDFWILKLFEFHLIWIFRGYEWNSWVLTGCVDHLTLSKVSTVLRLPGAEWSCVWHSFWWGKRCW